jgi:hypothetical protein
MAVLNCSLILMISYPYFVHNFKISKKIKIKNQPSQKRFVLDFIDRHRNGAITIEKYLKLQEL